MNTLARIPAIPAPPHDPTSLLLDGRAGWHTFGTPVQVDAADTIALSPTAASLPPIANAAGTFGNATLPSNVTVTADGTVLLLDATTMRLRRFDRCTCAFVDVKGVGGSGAPPRHWKDAHAIAACRDRLYICDTGHSRVAVYTLDRLGFVGDLRPPIAKHPTWEPYAIAFDSRAQVFVTDRAAGLVHRFDRRGHWQEALIGFSQPTAIAIDCLDRLWVVVAGASGLEVRIVDAAGAPVPLEPRADRMAEDFATLPFEVDVHGNLHLGPWCAPPPGSCAPSGSTPEWFGPDGSALSPAPIPAPVQFSASGEWIGGPLDSKLARCVWHRVILDAAIPDGTKILIESFTAEQAYSVDQVAKLATWATGQTARRVQGSWDCLLRSTPGRFLWLRLTLGTSGPATATPVVRRIEIEFPRIGARRYLPALFGAEPVSADFTDRFLALFDTPLRSIERLVDTEAKLFDPLSAPATRVGRAGIDFLSWLGTWIGVTLDRRWSEGRRRQFLKQAGRLFDRRGTPGGLRDQLSLLLGLDRYDGMCCREAPRRVCCPPPLNCAPEPPPFVWRRPALILEHFKLRRWLYVGSGRLGSEAVLWGSRIVNRSALDVNAQIGHSQLISTQDPLRDPYHVFAHQFSVFVPCRYRQSDADRRALEGLLKSESPAHTRHQLIFVEPRFRIGVQSMLGFDAVVGAVPMGVRLGSAPLGEGTVLTAKSGADGFAVGRGRIGSTGLSG